MNINCVTGITAIKNYHVLISNLLVYLKFNTHKLDSLQQQVVTFLDNPEGPSMSLWLEHLNCEDQLVSYSTFFNPYFIDRSLTSEQQPRFTMILFSVSLWIKTLQLLQQANFISGLMFKFWFFPDLYQLSFPQPSQLSSDLFGFGLQYQSCGCWPSHR